MSDCSTEAMKPKAKTCGNCNLNEAIKHLDELLSKDEFPCDECRADHVNLRGWLIELQSLEQRYQQLEQVAKELYWDVCNNTDYGFETVNKHVPKLEALGVSIDD